MKEGREGGKGKGGMGQGCHCRDDAKRTSVAIFLHVVSSHDDSHEQLEVLLGALAHHLLVQFKP